MKLSAAFLGLAMMAALPAAAADLTFTGNFRNDNDVLRFEFTIGSDRTIGVRSSSWQSGDPFGGFDPILTVTTTDGMIVGSQDDGSVSGTLTVNGTDYNYGVWDSFYDIFLAAGTYVAVITQFDNFPISSDVDDGFTRDGQPNFTFTQNFGGATQPLFNGVWDESDPRTSFWRFHLLNVDSVVVVDPNPVPAPGGLALFGLALAGLAAARRRKA